MSIRSVYTGAAPLGAETHEAVERAFPGWRVGQGYGMTETATVVTSTGENDVLVGSSGSLVPMTRAKIVARRDDDDRVVDGEAEVEITALETPGELLVQSPSVALGYLHNERATADAFVWDEDGRWIRTGDVAVVRKSPKGHLHFAIVDRIKELIKVKVRVKKSLVSFPLRFSSFSCTVWHANKFNLI
ncbi:hypothetical protein SLS62_003448 [Diatrype stigma]|uniref:AMP-dependent synthetase/ligase domain-containing protein n=1 Tax=Diatrype stigma TaxID=117547 RepID=A0AAN9V526_9PEZI